MAYKYIYYGLIKVMKRFELDPLLGKEMLTTELHPQGRWPECQRQSNHASSGCHWSSGDLKRMLNRGKESKNGSNRSRKERARATW